MFLRLPLLLARFLHNGRLRLVFLLLLLALFLMGIGYAYGIWQTDAQLCFMEQEPTHDALHAGQSETSGAPAVPKTLDDVLLSEPKPVPGRSIFFHETSCHRPKRRRQRPGQSPEIQYNMLQLTARQACAIESAALHNPNFQVFVLFAGPTYRHHGNNSSSSSSGSQRQQPLIDAILSYKNVQLRQLNLWRYATGTPIEAWLKDGELFRSRYILSLSPLELFILYCVALCQLSLLAHFRLFALLDALPLRRHLSGHGCSDAAQHGGGSAEFHRCRVEYTFSRGRHELGTQWIRA